MRQGQQNRRSRGRGRSRTTNPLSRNYESNGPDVKIKGTAAHIAEKYSALARDSLTSGNTVTAENYLQHAEHYNRIIMAAQAKQDELSTQQQSAQQHGKSARSGDHPRKQSNENRGEQQDSEIPGSGEQPKLNGVEAAAGNSPEKPKRKPRPRKPKAPKAEAAEATETPEKDTSAAV